MNLLIGTLNNVLNQIAKSIQLASLVPASILVLCNLVFVFPDLGIKVQETGFNSGLVMLVIVTISYSLWLLNIPFAKFLEGYPFYHTKLGVYMANRQRDKLRSLKERLRESKIHIERANRWLEELLPLEYYDNPNDLWEDHRYKKILTLKMQWEAIRMQALQELVEHFPTDVSKILEGNPDVAITNDFERVLPTKLGNTMAAFEHYPNWRYGIDGITLWPRFVPTLEKKGFMYYVNQEKAAFDFMLNLTIVAMLLAVESLLLIGVTRGRQWLIGVVVAGLAMLISSRILITSAVFWGNTFKIAFDLYRHEVAPLLLMKRPETLTEEKERWRVISSFLGSNQSPSQDVYDYRLLERIWEQSDEKSESEEE